MPPIRMLDVAASLLLVVFLPACSGGTDPGQDPFRLEGTWVWVSSVGGIAGVTRTPVTEGYSQRLELLSDGTLRLFRADTLTVETTWDAPGGSATGIPAVLEFGEPHPFGFPFANPSLTDGGATLLLRDPCCDGFERTFTRARE